MSAFGHAKNEKKDMTLPGLDYFDEETKIYSRLFEFCQVT